MRLMHLVILIQNHPGISAKDLASKCETSERTIYRDLDFLNHVTPLTNEGYKKGYQFLNHFAIYPMNWTEQEAMVFTLLPSVIEHVKRMLPPGFDTAYEKVMATHSKQKSKQMEMVRKITEMIQLGASTYQETQSNTLETIIHAILKQKTIHAFYHTQSRNEKTERNIDPYFLVPREHRFYLIGYCHKAQHVRTFRISRFRDVQPTELSFQVHHFNIHEYLKDTWSIERGNQKIEFKVKFNPDVARYVKEEELVITPKFTDLPDGSLLFEVRLNHDREFLDWISRFGPSAEILAPIEYGEMMRQKLMKWQKVYDNS
jgi:predicted DNA-binding transcriptional regulator YafY